METEEAATFLLWLAEEDQKERLWQQWLPLQQWVSWEEFYESSKPIELKPETEILEDVASIMNATKG
jgi:hypothetical protein